MRFAERVLHEREFLRERFERRIERLKTLQCVAQPFAGDPKIVQALLVAALQTSGQRARFPQSGPHDALNKLLHVLHALEVDPLRFHASVGTLGSLRCEVHAPKLFARLLSRETLLLAQAIEKRGGYLSFARVDPALEKPQNDGSIPCRIGCCGSSFDAAAQPLERRDSGDVFEEGAETTPRRPDVVQMLLVRLANEARACAF